MKLGADLDRTRERVVQVLHGRADEDVTGTGSPVPGDALTGAACWSAGWPRSSAGWACGLSRTTWTRRSRGCAGEGPRDQRSRFRGCRRLRTQEKQLLAARAGREKELAEAAAGRMPLAQELGRVRAELERLRAVLREHGIAPGDDAA